MAREFSRSARVSSQIQKELALILQRGIKDPRLGFITVNEVKVSKDLAIAKVYITVLNADDQAKQDNVTWLNESAPIIRSQLAAIMRLRHIPELRFFYDDSFDIGMRVAQLLREDQDDSDSSDKG